MYNNRRSFIKDLSKTELNTMRDNGMSNAEIARSLGCSPASVYNLIGAQPKEITRRSCQESARARTSRPVQSTSHSIQSAPAAVQEPTKAILAVKSAPILLTGEFMDYVVSADKKTIDVETSAGRCLMQIPADKLALFITELTAIKANIGKGAPLQFWG